MRLLIDTHALVWLPTGDRRLGKAFLAALESRSFDGYVSAVTAWEYVDLQARGRLPTDIALAEVLSDFDLKPLDLPADLWLWATGLPGVHGDPIDRMLVAHALSADLTIATADAKIRQYPVRQLW